jgi:hypothetical protein
VTTIEPVQLTFQGPMDVGQHRVGDVIVSTRYFGIGALYGEPAYWETMVLADGDEVDGYTARYDTAEDAARGHERTIAAVAAAIEQGATGELT